MTSVLRSTVLMIVLVGHGALYGIVSPHLFARMPPRDDPRDDMNMTAQLLQGPPEWDEVPLPDVHLHFIPVNLNSLQIIQFTDPDPETLDGIVGPSSAPHLARLQAVDSVEFARRAGILPGHPRTVVLTIEVLADGSPGDVSIVRGCGDPAIDAIAVEYARLLRWMPGTTNHEAAKEGIQLPVTLAVS